MKSSVEKLSDTRVKLTVNVPFEDLKTEIDQAYTALAQQVSIPGFRKGKAPRQLIDARYGRGPILEQVVNDMLPVQYQKAIEENEIVAIGQPTVDVTKIEDNEFVEFTAEVDIRPEFEVPDFSELSVTVPAIEVDDAAVDEEIDRLRGRFGELKDTR
ncbi:trigger factor family protein, partial [Corynebacterium sp.]|uniref:trigger factor n=1 Tax=Corynebacterium sp. TaxID=1720 RepID=UPI0019903D11